MSGSSHLLKTNARCLVAGQSLSDDFHEFLVGSASLCGTNEIRLLRYYDEDDEIDAAAAFNHPGEVVTLSTSSAQPDLIATIGNRAGKRVGAVWRLPQVPVSPDSNRGGAFGPPAIDMAQLCEIPASSSALQHLQWFPASDAASGDAAPGQLLSVDDSAAQVWQLRGAGAPTAVTSLQLVSASFIGGCAWDPHKAATEVAIACDSSVLCWDVRSGERPRSIAHAVPPGSCVRALSYNPNKPWHLATGGDDFRVKVWDLRKAAAPVKILDGHTHWVMCVAFNHSHDQLVLSGGADARVNLWSISSVSSAPLLELGDEEAVDPATGKKTEPKLAPDTCIRTLDDHEDTVHAAAWSARDAWVYATLSYTGKVVVYQVPAATKYKILL